MDRTRAVHVALMAHNMAAWVRETEGRTATMTLDKDGVNVRLTGPGADKDETFARLDGRAQEGAEDGG